MSALFYLLTAVLVALGPFAGRVVVPARWEWSETEALAVGAGITVLGLALAAPLLVVAPAMQLPVLLVLVAGMYWSLARGVLRRPKSPEVDGGRWVLALFVAQVLLKAALSVAWEFPAQGGDWFIHAVAIPSAFVRGEWAVPSERTALFSLLVLSAHLTTRVPLTDYWLSQLVSASVNSLVLFPAVLLARRLFGARAAVAAGLLVSVNMFLWYEALYTWPKNLAAFFVLSAFYFAIARERPSARDVVVAGVGLGAGFLSHPLAAFYVVPFGGFALWQRQVFRRPWYLMWGAAALTILPQILWTYLTRGTVASSRMLYYPLVTHSWLEAYQYDFATLWQHFRASPWATIVGNRVFSLGATLADLDSISSTRVYLAFYDSLWVALGGPSFILACVVVLRAGNQARQAAAYGVVLPLLLLTLFTGWPTGLLGGLGLHPTLVLLIVFASSWAERQEVRDTWRWWLSGFVLIELIDGLGQWLGLQTFYRSFEAASNWASLGTEGPALVPGFHLSTLRSAYYFVPGPAQQVLLVLTAGAACFALARWAARGVPAVEVGEEEEG